MFSCEQCSYTTSRKYNLTRHLNKKKNCTRFQKSVNPEDAVLDTLVYPSVNPVCTLSGTDGYPSKPLSNNSRYQCEICMKCFTSRHGKYKHKKNVYCKAPPPPPSSCNIPVSTKLSTITSQEIISKSTSSQCLPSSQFSMINNNGNDNRMYLEHSNNNSIQNAEHINNDNSVNINIFGKESLEYIENDPGIIQRLKNYSKKRVYGLRDIQNEIYFNQKHPENFTIIKPEKYGSDVLIRNDDGEFEFREFEDVKDEMKQMIEKYISIYVKLKNKENITLVERREREQIKQIVIAAITLNINIPYNLTKELGIVPEEYDEENPDIERKFDRSSLENLHIKTKKFFKAKNGEYVVNKLM